ncbi:tRNA uracil 4-sulfurtransferase ThiI [Halioxenophilus sp. WMMB6]|uniref:tRNA uracil 4-sulfurtransferase ThiI n=1 Tax=Halioxenophilus sp. WMMB6 TaxID=3073815 RepID=UPI00295F0C90|nr:tRNA uracil 4-sulfurtransferase ThiI [Halioxenophilus sp. WMMB6]
MHFIVKLFPEITIKSAPVRKRFTRQLQDNLHHLLRRLSRELSVRRDWEKLEISGPDDEELEARVSTVLAQTPGIAFFYAVDAFDFATQDDIYRATASVWGDQLAGKTFCVRVKRSGNHDFASIDVERYVGGGLNQNCVTGGVKLKEPDVTVKLEIKDDRLFVVRQEVPGLGGFPLGTQDPVLSLISGGFDSTVASYLTIKRGLRTHYCFFNMGGRAHELGCKEVAYYLWQKYGASHLVRFITVPFESVVAEILTKVPPANMGVILKRMMLRAASQIAERMKIQALVTGEAVAQVSSQTLTNLAVIDEVTNTLVLRPLITTDKGDIIKLARAIGTEEYAASMPEYCGVISKKPTTRAKLERVLADEALLDFAVLDSAVTEAKVESIIDLLTPAEEVPVDEFAYVPTAAVVIDIRHPNEQEVKPLLIPGVQVLTIPFYQLARSLEELAPKQQYLLYCDQGVMSRLHAGELAAEGHINFGVYRPAADAGQ